MLENQSCGECQFWHPPVDPKKDAGTCRLNPPQVVNLLAVSIQQAVDKRQLLSGNSMNAKMVPQLSNQITSFFPPMKPDDPGCSHYESSKVQYPDPLDFGSGDE